MERLARPTLKPNENDDNQSFYRIWNLVLKRKKKGFWNWRRRVKAQR